MRSASAARDNPRGKRLRCIWRRSSRRLKAAVVSDGNSENLAGPSYAPPGAVADAEQNIIAGLPEGIDRGDLLLAFAPNALLITYSQTDSGLHLLAHLRRGNKGSLRGVT